MSIREIKAALRRIENGGGDTRRLILAVPAKRGTFNRNDALRGLAEGMGESITEARKRVEGMSLGVLVRAELYDSHPMEGDLAFIDKNQYEHTGEIVYPNPDDLRWGEAQIIDDNGEFFDLDRWEDAVNGILYGSSARRGGMYFGDFRGRSRNPTPQHRDPTKVYIDALYATQAATKDLEVALAAEKAGTGTAAAVKAATSRAAYAAQALVEAYKALQRS